MKTSPGATGKILVQKPLSGSNTSLLIPVLDPVWGNRNPFCIDPVERHLIQ